MRPSARACSSWLVCYLLLTIAVLCGGSIYVDRILKGYEGESDRCGESEAGEESMFTDQDCEELLVYSNELCGVNDA